MDTGVSNCVDTSEMAVQLVHKMGVKLNSTFKCKLSARMPALLGAICCATVIPGQFHQAQLAATSNKCIAVCFFK